MSLSRSKPMVRTAFARKPAATSKAPAAEPKPSPGPRKRKCQHCKTPFTPFRALEAWCSPECGAEVAKDRLAKQRAKQERIERAETKAKLVSMRPAKWWRAKAKHAMHAYVRAIGEGKPCCSCDTILVKAGRMGGDYDAGHLRSVALAKHLEFDPRNVWAQCKSCNGTLKRGNIYEYERRLRIKIGDAEVDALMADNQERHLKIPDFQAIEAHYKLKLKELQP